MDESNFSPQVIELYQKYLEVVEEVNFELNQQFEYYVEKYQNFFN